MAASITQLPRQDDVIGSRTRKRSINFVGDTSYPTGGYTNIKKNFGMVDIDQMLFMPRTVAAAAYEPIYDYTNDKLILINADTRAQIANTTDVSAASFRITALGS